MIDVIVHVRCPFSKSTITIVPDPDGGEFLRARLGSVEHHFSNMSVALGWAVPVVLGRMQ